MGQNIPTLSFWVVGGKSIPVLTLGDGVEDFCQLIEPKGGSQLGLWVVSRQCAHTSRKFSNTFYAQQVQVWGYQVKIQYLLIAHPCLISSLPQYLKHGLGASTLVHHNPIRCPFICILIDYLFIQAAGKQSIIIWLMNPKQRHVEHIMDPSALHVGW
ncbi:hypothetical protein C0993_008152 [Termitomyces sp. T159_Od127]|nr:hypothetical protein C0993_008152 [Termitomyces sp. T159_Od127]